MRVRREYFDSGRIQTSFGEDGGAEDALVYLGDSHEHVLAVRITGFTAEVRIVEGEALADAETDLDLADDALGGPVETDKEADEPKDEDADASL